MQTETQPQHRALQADELAVLKEKIKDVRVAMLTTLALDGDFHTRPMSTNEMEDDGTMWFFIYDNSNKVAEIQQNNRVALGFSDPGDDLYVSVSGTAEVVKDRAKIDELWSDILHTWFPKGKDDPMIALLKVNIYAGEFWDRPGGKMSQLFALAKGALLHKPDTEGRNEKFGDEPS